MKYDIGCFCVVVVGVISIGVGIILGIADNG